MKKLILIISVSALGFLIGFGITRAFNSDDESVYRPVQQSTETAVVSASYSPVMAFQGPDFTTAAEKTVHAVVHIRSEFTRRSNAYDDFFAPFRDFFGEPHNNGRVYSGFGSGVIISDDGYMVTNNHVVEGASFVEVTLNDRRTLEAHIIGRDPNSDLALIKVDASDLPYLSYGNSDDVKVGEWVLAVGNPFNLTSTVTAGIVSAKARNINILGTPGAIETFIQTDAVVNRGNSGGALVNTEGNLIGINAAIASNTGYYAGYSFAIPINIVEKVVNDLLNYGQVQRAYIGVVIREVNAEIAEEAGLEQPQGVFVERLSENGGAEEAGMERGDVIVAIDNTKISTTAQLLEVIGQHTPGDMVSVSVMREGSKKIFDVELKNEVGSTNIAKRGDTFFIEELGAKFEAVSKSEKEELNISHGLKVSELGDGMLRNGDIKVGYIILEINNIQINQKEDIEYAMNNIKSNVIRIEGIYPNGEKMNYGFIY